MPGAPAHGKGQNRPCPEIDLAIVGDLHGRADLLASMLKLLERRAPDAKKIFVGDYIDRGPHSKETIEILRGLADAEFLCGNHEVMLLEFLDDPISFGGRWLRNGGTATLASYGISLDMEANAVEIQAARDQLKSHLSDGTEQWLRALPLSYASGNMVVTHAGPDPSQPIQGQQDDVFLWGHQRFLRDARTDGIWVAHGHWIRPKPECANGRIAIDTGAWKSDKLTAALASPGGTVKFVTAR